MVPFLKSSHIVTYNPNGVPGVSGDLGEFGGHMLEESAFEELAKMSDSEIHG